jgi:hypothetical protein
MPETETTVAPQPTPETPPIAPPPAAPQTFDQFMEAQTPEAKTLLETHTQGLKSALESERGTRKDLEKQVRDLAGKAEKGSEAEKQLTQIADTVAAAERKADFMEAAHAAGVSNLKLAYTVAVQDEMFDRHGRANFEAMKATYPELFGGGKPTIPPANAGDGTGNKPPAPASMTGLIRQAAGR